MLSNSNGFKDMKKNKNQLNLFTSIPFEPVKQKQPTPVVVADDNSNLLLYPSGRVRDKHTLEIIDPKQVDLKKGPIKLYEPPKPIILLQRKPKKPRK